MTNIRRYTVEDKPLWDAFVAKSRNSTFLFLRNYMEYHRQRFTDHSLLCFDKKGRLIAILPANESLDEEGNKRLVSHQGLTYGGLVLSEHTSANDVLSIMEALVEYASREHFSYILYKALPPLFRKGQDHQEPLPQVPRHRQSENAEDRKYRRAGWCC